MKRLAFIASLLLGLGLVAGPAAASGPDQLDPVRPSAAGEKQCSWKWKTRKVVKWVHRDGRLKRVVRFRKVRVRVCRVVPPADPARLGVKAYEFGFTLSAKSLTAGDTIVELNNRGEDAHDLHIQRVGGGEELSTPETGPGEQNRIRFTTTPGSYRLWCSLPNHAAWGMDTTFNAG
ncbi:MAG: hypothetical protein KDB52_02490 [Solirubrobacterales bacterium]|nr:hypothetical protein [Solirubrobacterales bacterium]